MLFVHFKSVVFVLAAVKLCLTHRLPVSAQGLLVASSSTNGDYAVFTQRNWATYHPECISGDPEVAHGVIPFYLPIQGQRSPILLREQELHSKLSEVNSETLALLLWVSTHVFSSSAALSYKITKLLSAHPKGRNLIPQELCLLDDNLYDI